MRVVLAGPLISSLLVITTAASFLVMVSARALFVLGAVSVVAMVMVGAVAVFVLT